MTGAELCEKIKKRGIEDLEIFLCVPDENAARQVWPSYRRFKKVEGIDEIAPTDGYATLGINEF